MTKAFDQLKVLEVRGSAAGGYAGRLFATWGADVTLATLEHEDPGRPSDEALDVFLDHGKRQLNTHQSGLSQLVDEVDVVIESSIPKPLTPRTQPRSGLVRVEISPLGPRGPLAGRWSTELTDQARSGHLLLNGDPDREPIAGPAHQVSFAAGLHGFIGATAALAATERSADLVQVNHLQVMASLHQFTLIRRRNGGHLLRRMGNRWAGPGSPVGIYACNDGYLSIIVPRDDQLERLLAVADKLDLLATPGIDQTYDLMHHPTLLDEHLRPWFAAQEVEPLVELLQAVRVPAAPVSTMADLLADPHLSHRSSLVQVGEVRMPGPPASLSPLGPGSPLSPDSGSTSDASAPTSRTKSSTSAVDTTRPLRGLRVVDLSRVWAGPLASRILSDLGADVVMVEAPWARGGPTIDRASVDATGFYPNNEGGADHWNRTGFVNKYALGKRSVSLDLSDATGVGALEALIKTADVVLENFSPRVMPQFDLDQDRLHELQPDLIYVTMPGYGRTGPDKDRVAYGPIVDAHAGLATLMGYEGEQARSAGVAWPDPIAGLHAAAATMVALLNRQAGTGGSVVEVAQIETTIAMVGPALVEYQQTNRLPSARGNRDGNWPLQAVVRCQGDDRWVAVSVIDPDGWHHVAQVLGIDLPLNSDPSTPEPGLSEEELSDEGPSDEGLSDEGLSDESLSEEAELDRALRSWAENRSQQAVEDALTFDGVAVSVVADAQQVLDAPQLAALDAWTTSEHPSAGTEIWPRTAITLDGNGLEPQRAAPRLGEHNELLTDEVGMTVEKIQQLVAAGILTDRPPD